jgi:hypothetical protein
MTDFPGQMERLTPIRVNSHGRLALGEDLSISGISSTPATFTWVANLAVFIPITLPWRYVVRRVFWANGSSLGNVNMGVYSLGGTKIFDIGSTAQSGASSMQWVSLANAIVLPANNYYLAWACDTTTSRAYGTSLTTASLTNYARSAGLLQQAVGSLTLPAAATFAAYSGTAGLPLCGLDRRASGF